MAIVLFMNSEDGEEQVSWRRIMDAFNPFELDNAKFFKNFRLNKSAFKYVLGEMATEIQSWTSVTMRPIVMLATTLRFVAEGGYQS